MLPRMSRCPRIFASGKSFLSFISNNSSCSHCSCVRVSVGWPSAFIANADGATVPGAAVRTHFQKLAVLGHTSVTTDIKMIPHRAETSRLVVTEQLLGGVIPGGACGAAMNDDIFHGSGGCHHRAVLLSEESTFVRDLFLTDYHRESFLNHG